MAEFTPEQEQFIEHLVNRKITQALEILLIGAEGQLTMLSLAGALAATLRRALLKKGALTNEELAAAEQEMRAAAEVDRVFDPQLRDIDNKLKELREWLKPWLEDQPGAP